MNDQTYTDLMTHATPHSHVVPTHALSQSPSEGSTDAGSMFRCRVHEPHPSGGHVQRDPGSRGRAWAIPRDRLSASELLDDLTRLACKLVRHVTHLLGPVLPTPSGGLGNGLDDDVLAHLGRPTFAFDEGDWHLGDDPSGHVMSSWKQ